MSGFLDTNLVVRYFAGDVPEMTDIASRIIDGEDELIVTDLVLAETAWVLTTVYDMPREEIIDHLIAFARRENIVIYGIDKGLALEALLLCRPSGRVSLPDALTWAAARSSGNNVVYSLDMRFPDSGVEVRRDF